MSSASDVPPPIPMPTPNPPVVPPSPAPIQVTVPPDWFMRTCMVLMILILLFDHSGPTPVKPPDNPPPKPPPAPVANMTTLGHDYVVIGLAESWADGMDAAGNAVEGTDEMADIEKAYISGWQNSLKSTFGTMVKPSLQSILPSGGALTPANRPVVGKAFKDLAKGARTVK